MSYKPFAPSTGVEKRFAWLSAIPHGSGNEKALSDAIRALATEAGLETWQDDLGNLLVRRCAAPGCEQKETVMLQAHLDMVCTKEPGCSHHFETDSLKLVVDEDGWLHAEGTSLGCDDGYGVAYMIEMMLSDGLKLPELECLFTVQEEVGLIGAANMDMSRVKARRLISMDSAGEEETTVSTCGGRRYTFSLPLKPAQASGGAWKITVGRLTGGHSAGVIHLSRANAIKMLGHTLLKLEKTGATLVAAKAGEASNAIPRDGWAVVRIPDDRLDEAKRIFEEMRARFMKAHAFCDPDMLMTMEPAEADGPAYDMTGARFLTALPDGLRAMEPARPHVPALSSNLGVMSVKDGALSVSCMIRSASEEWRALLSEQVQTTGETFGADFVIDSDYPGMEYNPDSVLRGRLKQLMRDRFGVEVEEHSSHGGMEIGYFSRWIEGVDIVTLACNSSGAHSPSEKMELVSFNRMYDVLVELIEGLE